MGFEAGILSGIISIGGGTIILAVNLLSIDGTRLIVRGLDALDGTPMLDIKPYSPKIDCIKE
jgi:tRNA (Thr-GGU) A37 N-methylase